MQFINWLKNLFSSKDIDYEDNIGECTRPWRIRFEEVERKD